MFRYLSSYLLDKRWNADTTMKMGQDTTKIGFECLEYKLYILVLREERQPPLDTHQDAFPTSTRTCLKREERATSVKMGGAYFIDISLNSINKRVYRA